MCSFYFNSQYADIKLQFTHCGPVTGAVSVNADVLCDFHQGSPLRANSAFDNLHHQNNAFHTYKVSPPHQSMKWCAAL